MAVTDQAAALGQEMSKAVGAQAESLAGRSKDASADMVASAARTAEAVAESVAEQSPALAEYVRGAGEKIDRLATDLRDKSVGDLLNQAAGFARSQPVVLIAGAALVGFALSRLIKAGAGAATAGTASDAASRAGSVG